MSVSPSQLRADIYRVIDEVLATGEPVEIRRRGRSVYLVAEPPAGSRLERVRPVAGAITTDPEELVHIDWSSEWRP